MRPFSTSRGGRRGNVTIIVVAFLALFLVLGLTFAFYSIGEADQAKVYRDAANGGQTGVWPTTHDGAPPEPDTLFNAVMSDVIYGPPTTQLANPQEALQGSVQRLPRARHRPAHLRLEPGRPDRRDAAVQRDRLRRPAGRPPGVQAPRASRNSRRSIGRGHTP